MSLGAQAIRDALSSHAAASGLFDWVGQHEPLNPPGNGLACAVLWLRFGPGRGSGLAATTGKVLFGMRITSPSMTEPRDNIDATVINATDVLFAALIGDFTLGDTTLPGIDVRGRAGEAMTAEGGWLRQDSSFYRLATITVPVLVNDAWPEVP